MLNKENVFNIDPNNVKSDLYTEIYNYDYNFLNFIEKTQKIIVKNYYNLINSIHYFQLNSLYQFIFLKINKIKKLDNEFDLLNKNFKINNPKIFNNILKEYINDDLLKSIIIINSIQQYFIPIKI